MTHEELKKNIVNNSLLDDLIVFVCTADPKGKVSHSKKINYGAHYLADQYIQLICQNKGYDIKPIETLTETEPTSIDLIMGGSNNLYVLRTDTFSELHKDYSKFENTIIVCDKVDKKVADKLGVFIVYISEPEQWATEAFMNFYCPGVAGDLLSWLFVATEGNVYRMTSELDKAKLFAEAERTGVLMALRDEPNSDLYINNVFNFVDALFLGDYATVREIREHIDCLDADPVGLTTLLLNKFKNIFLAVTTNLSADDLNMSPKQLGFYRRQYRYIDEERFREKIKFLAGIDLRLKQTRLDMPKTMFIDYIIAHILA